MVPHTLSFRARTPEVQARILPKGVVCAHVLNTADSYHASVRIRGTHGVYRNSQRRIVVWFPSRDRTNR